MRGRLPTGPPRCLLSSSFSDRPLPLSQLYQKLHEKLEDYHQKVSLASRDRLYRHN